MCIYIYIYIYIYVSFKNLAFWPTPRVWRNSYESRVRLKGYGGPFQSSETITMICHFNTALFNSTPLAYICKQSTVERVRKSFSELWQFYDEFICQQYVVQTYSASLRIQGRGRARRFGFVPPNLAGFMTAHKIKMVGHGQDRLWRRLAFVPPSLLGGSNLFTALDSGTSSCLAIVWWCRTSCFWLICPSVLLCPGILCIGTYCCVWPPLGPLHIPPPSE